MAALTFGVLGGSAAAQDPAPVSATAVRGECISLAIAGQDITADCGDGVLLGHDATGGRSVGFTVTKGFGAIRFSGHEETGDGGQLLRLDRLTLVSPGGDNDTVLDGTGECRWSYSINPARVTCQFTSEDGTPATGAFGAYGVLPPDHY
ncbi:hypothetical protein [Brevundimonas sp. GCM10030266]|uniref:hypothetical protein n=1 Tax=Brevundimonas sp. GCM10030266 TaxID=3273386 RepID=UPI00360888EF